MQKNPKLEYKEYIEKKNKEFEKLGSKYSPESIYELGARLYSVKSPTAEPVGFWKLQTYFPDVARYRTHNGTPSSLM